MNNDNDDVFIFGGNFEYSYEIFSLKNNQENNKIINYESITKNDLNAFSSFYCG